MKTIQQRLQSRISRRRNFIRYEEEVLATMKQQRRNVRNCSDLFGVKFPTDDLIEKINGVRDELKGLADDQRLDKRIKQVLSEQDSIRRFYGLLDLA